MNPPTTKTRPAAYDWVIIAVFVAVISLPLVRQLAGNVGGTEEHEKRRLAPVPAWPRTWAAAGKFPSEFTKYYTDNFGFRADLIQMHAWLMYRGLGLSPSDLVLAGRTGWFYYADDYSLEDFRSLQPFTPAELERWSTGLEQQQAWLAQRGARFLLVLACEKYIIYPEYMPAAFHRANAPYRVDQLAEYLQRHSTVPVVALHEPLAAAKAHDRLYHRTDTHWNDRGAYVGYREITTRLREWFPAIELQPLTVFSPVGIRTDGQDLARMMGLEDVVAEEDLRLVPRRHEKRAYVVDSARPDFQWNSGRIALEQAKPTLPRAVIFRDSFGSALIPFLAEDFRRSVFLWQYDFDPAIIAKEQPDVVILLITSRRLLWFVPTIPASKP